MRLFPLNDPGHRYPQVTSARVLAAVFDLAVGLRLLMPDDSLGSSPGYALAREHFLSDAWLGIALIAFGAVMAAGLYTDRLGRAVDAAVWLGGLTWLLFAVDLTVVNPSQLGTFAYGILGVGVHAYAFAHLLLWRDQTARDAAHAAAERARLLGESGPPGGLS